MGRPISDCGLLAIAHVLAHGDAGVTTADIVELLRPVRPERTDLQLREYVVSGVTGGHLRFAPAPGCRRRKLVLPGSKRLAPHDAVRGQALLLKLAREPEPAPVNAVKVYEPARSQEKPPQTATVKALLPVKQRLVLAQNAPSLPLVRCELRSVFECVLRVPLRDKFGVHGSRNGAGEPKS